MYLYPSVKCITHKRRVASHIVVWMVAPLLPMVFATNFEDPTTLFPASSSASLPETPWQLQSPSSWRAPRSLGRSSRRAPHRRRRCHRNLCQHQHRRCHSAPRSLCRCLCWWRGGSPTTRTTMMTHWTWCAVGGGDENPEISCLHVHGLQHTQGYLRSAETSALLVPSTSRSTLGDRSFPVAAARAWNALSCNTFGTRLLFPSFAENWRPFCSGRRSLMRSDNVLCFICMTVTQCWSVTMYWLLQTDFIDNVRWSCSSSAKMPPK